MDLFVGQLQSISKIRAPMANLESFATGINDYAAEFGLGEPHRQAHFIAQVMHETGGLKWDREIWGPTATQKRYEGRKDLGNTQPGDGSKFRGYGFIQTTGRANVTEFLRWCQARGYDAPNFVARPELIATTPWSTVSALWYWDTRGLNRFADANDIEMITRRINGGLNGFADRLDYYARTGLVLLGYRTNDVGMFQVDAGITADGIAGPATRAALHLRLTAMAEREVA